MGFILSKYTNNEAGLTVAFNGNVNTENYFAGDNLQEAMDYFGLYINNGHLLMITEEELAFEELGLENTTEVAEFREKLDNIIANYNDEDALENIILYATWAANKSYEVGTKVRYNGVLYKVLQTHTSQIGWEPTAAASLFARILVEDPNVIYEWEQPDSTNGYATGDKVTHNGHTWISTADNNVWEPGTTGAPWELYDEEELAPEPEPEPIPEPEPESEVAPWEQKSYMIGDRVSFEGSIYESTIDNNVWSPSAYPAGWQLIIE